jgi:hypothetical protein
VWSQAVGPQLLLVLPAEVTAQASALQQHMFTLTHYSYTLYLQL